MTTTDNMTIEIHVTRVSSGSVYGHETSHCNEAGCNGTEQFYPQLTGWRVDDDLEEVVRAVRSGDVVTTFSAADLDAVRANARGEGVYCGDEDGALTIALSALDGVTRDDLDDDQRALLVRVAREAWESSR